MTETTINQLYSFFTYVGVGILIVLIFDIFRVFRKSFKTSDTITFIEDIIFIVIVSIILLYSIFRISNGQLRLYIFLGLLIGGIIYLLTISKLFIKVNVIIITAIKRAIANIFKFISYPFKILFKCFRKLCFKPISFFFFNCKKIFTNKNKKEIFLTRKSKVKKGF